MIPDFQYLTENNLNRFDNREIFVFGTGMASNLFMEKYENKIKVKAFIDNNSDAKRKFWGKRVLSVGNMLDIRTDEPIVLAVFNSVFDITEQLLSYNRVPIQDIYVWDDMCLFHMDDNVKTFYKKILSINLDRHKHSDNRKVLLEAQWSISTLIYPEFCLANYFADKYDASINLVLPRNRRPDNFSPVVRKLMEVSNLGEIIDNEMTIDTLKERDEIFDRIWSKLRSWDDWKEIVVYGIDFGSTFTRNFMRFCMPDFNARSDSIRQAVYESISSIVFWKNYLERNDVKTIILLDGVNNGGFLRDLAVTKGIPVYAMTDVLQKCTYNFHPFGAYSFFKSMWDSLTEKEKQISVKWGKEHLERRINGDSSDLLNKWDRINFSFAEKEDKKRVLEKNDKLKLIIFPHSFEEDSCLCGGNLFDDNYFLWLCHLGELSEKTPFYDWYIKPHPASFGRDIPIIDMIVKKYQRIKKLPMNLSPIQLRDEGVKFALTISGSIGHEYPYIGINVINAGVNPHDDFGFNITPKSVEEYDKLIMNLQDIHFEVDKEMMYKFYAMNYLIYDWDYLKLKKIFFWKPEVACFEHRDYRAVEREMGTWIFKEFVDTMPDGWHERIVKQMPELVDKIEKRQPDIFYKRKEFIDLMKTTYSKEIVQGDQL